MCYKIIVIFLVEFLVAVKSNPIPFKDCGKKFDCTNMFMAYFFIKNVIRLSNQGSSSSVKVNYFDVKDCSTFPCVLKRNETYTLKLNFTSSKKIF